MKIQMNRLAWDVEKPGFKGRFVHTTDHVRLTQLVIEPGGKVPAHQVGVEVFFYVISGSGVITLAGTAFEVAEGDVLTLAPETMMEIQAAAEQQLVLLNVKTPTPPEMRSGAGA